MKMSKGFMLFMACLGLVGVTGAVIASSSPSIMDNVVLAQTRSPSYSCSSIHFGMNDSDRKAKTYDCSNLIDTANNKNTAWVSNYLIADQESSSHIQPASAVINKVYFGDANNNEWALKFGSSSVGGTMTLTFDQNICGCTLYLLGYKTDSAEVAVNGVSKTLNHNITTISKKAAASREEYYPYTWNFDSTQTLSIESNADANCRFFLADIAIRVG